MTKPAVVSIDPQGARELDDAIGVTPLAESGWRVDVCIPDVPSMLARDDAADAAARVQGTSRYVADGRVHRMLPPTLVDQLSLSPVEDRPMVHVVIEVDRRMNVSVAAVRRISHRTLASLSYAAADDAISNPSHPLHGVLRDIWNFAKVLHEERAAKTGATFDVTGGTYTNEEGQTVRFETGAAHPSNMAVMEIMILANSALASWARTANRAVLYRNHRLPGFAAGHRQDAAIELAEREGLGPATAARRLRTMGNTIGPAEMGLEPLGHHGLDLRAYAWFTSPLRRYCDIVNLRAVLDDEKDQALADLAIHLTTVHRARNQDNSDHHARRSRSRILDLLVAYDSSALDRYDVRTIVHAFVENSDFDRESAIRLLAKRMAEDGLSGRDIASLDDEVETLFGKSAHDAVTAWIAENAARRMLLDEHRGVAVPVMPSDGRNHRGRLQEHAATAGAGLRYGDPRRVGPPHSPLFTVAVSWSKGGAVTTGEGTGKTVKAAEHGASKDLIEKLGLAPAGGANAITVDPVAPTTSNTSAKSRLMEHVQANPGSSATFGKASSSGPAHAPVFTMEVVYSEGSDELRADGRGRSKKEAEQDASARILRKLSST